MSFTLELTDEQSTLRDKAHAFAREVIRPVAAEYDRAQEFPLPVLEEAASQGFYGWELYAQLSADPTGLSLPILAAGDTSRTSPWRSGTATPSSTPSSRAPARSSVS